MGICINCFYSDLKDYVCPKCRYDNRKEEKKPLMLPVFTTLMNGRFLIGRVLGAGGFGITYKAYDNATKKIVAVKEYAPLNIGYREPGSTYMQEVGSDKRKVYLHCKKRFYEEAKSIYQCRGIPEIVSIETYFEENNTAYFVMEYIGDNNLRRLMKAYGNRIPLPIAARVTGKIGRGLERVHRDVGIFHRDISPENIMLGSDDKTVKLIDFGSAKFIAKGETEVQSGLTVVLKPGYAPPEQYYSNGKQGPFTDVYALAATFYYIVSGQMIADAPKRSLGADPYIPLIDMGIEGMTKEISDAVDRALELDYSKRTRSVQEFVCHFDNFLEDEDEDVSVVTASGHPYVRVVKGEGAGTKWPLPEDKPVVLGRAARTGKPADIIVTATNREISRAHIELEYHTDSGDFSVTVLQSLNGTEIKGVEMETGDVKEIKTGEHIILGLNTMELEVGVE